MFANNKNSNAIKIIKNNLELLNNDGINIRTLEKIMESIIPRTNKEIKLNIYEKHPFITASFDPTDENISLAINKIHIWLNTMVDYNLESCPNCSKKELENYLLLFILYHEVEHSKQYLIGKKYLPTPYEIVQQGYELLFKILIKDDSINPIKRLRTIPYLLYKIKDNYYILERNACIEAYNILIDLSKEENNNELTKMFTSYKNAYLQLGYKGKYNGSLEETSKNMLLGFFYNRFNNTEDISMEERIRYGLPIDKESKKKVLNYKI